MPSGFLYLNCLDRYISSINDVCLVLLIPCFVMILELNANSVDPDQTPHFAASDLGLHLLPMFLLWEATHKWVNQHREDCAS